MSKDNCYEYADYVGDFAGGVTTAGLTTESIGVGTVPAIGLGTGVNFGVDHIGESVCDAMYAPPPTLEAMEYNPDTQTMTYAWGHEGSSEISIDEVDVSCQPLDEGLCYSADPISFDSGVDGY